MTINFNVQPYYDDFNEDEFFHRILFKPGVAVQARELTQLQTILQKQIERFGRHVFKEGAMVIPGQASIDGKANFVTFAALTNVGNIDDLVGVTLLGGTSGVVAIVIAVEDSIGVDPPTLIIKYVNSGNSGSETAFTVGEIIYYNDGSNQSIGNVQAVGRGSLAQIEEGVYFVAGNFVKVEKQTIILDKYSSNPSYRVGLLVDEQLVTAAEDSSLNDNAIGTYNYAAPGADRYKIYLRFAKLDLDTELDQDFIELIRVVNGTIVSHVTRSEYAELEKTLARRTYDESGDYTVRPFQIQVREYRNNDRGVWESGKLYVRNDIVKYPSANSTSYICLVGHTAGTFATDIISSYWIEDKTPEYNDGVYNVSSYPAGTSATYGNTLLAVGLDPGKAYVRGYEIEKIATEFIEVPKAQTVEIFQDDFISTQVGNYLKITNLHKDLNGTAENFASVNLYNRLTSSRGTPAGTLVGRAKIRYIEFESGTPGETTAIYKVSLFDVQMNTGRSFDRDVKQIVNSTNNATADVIYSDSVQLRGTITVGNGSATAITGVGTAFLTQLKAGDYIVATGNTTPIRIASITSDLLATATNQGANVTGASYGIILSPLQEVDKQSLLFRLPQVAIKDVSDVTLRITKKFTVTPSAGSGTITAGTGEEFESTRTSDYIAINSVSGNVAPISSITLGGTPTGQQATLDGFPDTDTYSVYTRVVKSLALKSKVETNATVTFSKTAAAATILSLGQADVFKIDSITSNNVEIKDQYTLDDGQRPTHYGISRIIRKSQFGPPPASLTVKYRYFSHNNTGDCFTANSYAVGFKEIPTFTNEGITVKLSDVLDFRPRINNEGTSFTSGTSYSLSSIPTRDFSTQLDYSYYLPRKDKIVINQQGQFSLVQGIPSLQPEEPQEPQNSMVLYGLELQPYTIDAKDVLVKYIDNKRYTMRDIGRLEKRIENIEYYTALSLLEQETKSFNILDDNGLDRFKSGFVVDNFTGHGVGDVTQPDYLCSIDMEENILRPFFYMDNFSLIYSAASGIKVTGGIATLNYTSIPFIDQPYASKTENVNPYNVFTFIGDLKLHPEKDEWFEVNRLPDVIINEEGNFDSVSARAEAQGALGTVWSSWQTQWTGTPIRTSVQRTTESQTNRGWPIRNVTTETFATNTTQSRSKITTRLVATENRRTIADRILSSTLIPFIRSRAVAFVARGLKPNTRFFPLFDGVTVTPHVVPATRITLNVNVGGFDSATPATTGIDSNARSVPRTLLDLESTDNIVTASANTTNRMGRVSSVALNRGDIVTNASGNSAIVLHKDIAANTLHVVNIIGTFAQGDVITGSISGASGQITNAVAPQAQGNVLLTSSIGDVAGLFFIPNRSALKFRTGVREFKLTSSAQNVDTGNSYARANYEASGVRDTSEAIIGISKNAELVREVQTETRTVTSTNQRTTRTDWYDPLAQTFLVQIDGGAFLTKVDIWFATKDTTTNLPVTLEIREVVNGYPGQRILPNSRVVKAANEVSVSANASIATTFTFPQPIYVSEQTEYALVLLSDSNAYNVWIAQTGQLTVGGDRLISEQPYMGSLFKSQNASTWTPDQTQDLKFKIYRASFSPLSGVLTMKNDALPVKPMQTNPILTTNTTSTVKITHLNHGFKNGSTVRLYNAEGTETSNIALNNINKTHVVSNVSIDYYTVNLANIANVTGLIGGDAMVASKNIEFDAVQPIVQFLNFPQTFLDFSTITTKIDDTTETSIVMPNNTNYFVTPRVVKSAENDGGSKTFTLLANFVSTKENLSPAIDLNSMSVITVKNKVNKPTPQNWNIGGIIDTRQVVANANIGFYYDGTNSVLYTSNTDIANSLLTLSSGREIVITGASNVTNNANVIVSSIDSEGNVTVSGYVFANTTPTFNVNILSKEGYVDEIAPFGGSVISKYITRQINLKTPATFIKVMFAASIPPDTDVDLYYKTLPAGSYITMSDIPYTYANATIPAVKTIDSTRFSEVEYEISNLDEFSSLVIKLAFRVDPTKSPFVPLIKDLRIIACA